LCLFQYNRIMPLKTIYLSVGLFLLIQFVIFSYLVHENLFTQFDFNTTVRLQDNIGRNWDNEFSLFSDLGKFEVTTLVLLAIFVFARKIFAGIMAFGAYVVFHLIEIFGKTFLEHTPPPQFMLRTEQILHFPQFHVRTENSFPSGHSGRTIFISVILLLFIWQSSKLPKIAKLTLTGFILGFDAVMLVSRVTLGEHWATDVIGGSLLGASMGFFVGMFLTKKEDHHPHKDHKKSFLPKYKVEIKRVE
jgi:undecaprenyl-diphosphatase